MHFVSALKYFPVFNYTNVCCYTTVIGVF